jgi:hypothetical protein
MSAARRIIFKLRLRANVRAAPADDFPGRKFRHGNRAFLVDDLISLLLEMISR